MLSSDLGHNTAYLLEDVPQPFTVELRDNALKQTTTASFYIHSNSPSFIVLQFHTNTSAADKSLALQRKKKLRD
jgi:hypothetical protein